MRVRVPEGKEGFYNEQIRKGYTDEKGVYHPAEFDIAGPKDFGSWMELVNPDDLTDAEKEYFAKKAEIIKRAANGDQTPSGSSEFNPAFGERQTQFILREKALADRELDIANIEKGLADRELGLAEAEEALAAKEQELIEREKALEASASSKKK